MESDFSKIWEGVRKTIEDEAIAQGNELSMPDKSWNVPV
jgi:hypothetical protein